MRSRYLFAIAAAIISLCSFDAYGQTSPLAPPGECAVVADAPDLPPEFALEARAEDGPVLDSSDVADVRSGLVLLPPPPLRVDQLLVHPLARTAPDPLVYAVVKIPLDPPPQFITPPDERFDKAYIGLFVLWLVGQGFDYSTTWDAMAECPECREGNVLLRDPVTKHPNAAIIISAKAAVGGISAIAEYFGYGKIADGILWGGIAGAAASVPINTTVGKDGETE